MVICAMLKCGNRSKRDKDKRFYRLPSVITHQGEQTLELSKRRQSEWLARIKRADLKPEQYANTRVCSDHFVSGSPSALFDQNNLDWAPSLNLGYESVSMPSIEARSERYGRVVARSRKRALATRDEIPESDVDSVEGNSVSTQTDLSMRGMEEVIAKREDEISDLQTQLEVTKEENKKLHQTTKKIEQQLQEYKLNEASFENDNNVLYWVDYMGITSEAIHLHQATSEAALIPFAISTATCDTAEITFDS